MWAALHIPFLSHWLQYSTRVECQGFTLHLSERECVIKGGSEGECVIKGGGPGLVWAERQMRCCSVLFGQAAMYSGPGYTLLDDGEMGGEPCP